MALKWGGPTPVYDGEGKVERLRWRPVLSIPSLLFGVLLDLGVEILLQQLGVAPFTTASLVRASVIGLLAGLLFPSLGAFIGVRWGNSRIRKARRKQRRGGRALLIMLAAWLFLLVAPFASADVEGPCTVTVNDVPINGHDAGDASEAVRVDRGDVISYSVASLATPPASYQFHVAYGPVTFEADAGTWEGTELTELGSMTVPKDRWPGIGLYQGRMEVVLADGQTCVADILFNVQGALLSTPLGLVSVGAVGAGGAGVIATGVAAAAQAKDIAEAALDAVKHAGKAGRLRK